MLYRAADITWTIRYRCDCLHLVRFLGKSNLSKIREWNTEPDVKIFFMFTKVVLIFKSLFGVNWCSISFADIGFRFLFGFNQYLNNPVPFQYIYLDMYWEQMSSSHWSISLSINLIIQQISPLHAIHHFAATLLCKFCFFFVPTMSGNASSSLHTEHEIDLLYQNQSLGGNLLA